jgi:hypothetical protein
MLFASLIFVQHKLNTPKNIYTDSELKAGFIQSEKIFNNIININNTF